MTTIRFRYDNNNKTAYYISGDGLTISKSNITTYEQFAEFCKSVILEDLLIKGLKH